MHTLATHRGHSKPRAHNKAVPWTLINLKYLNKRRERGCVKAQSSRWHNKPHQGVLVVYRWVTHHSKNSIMKCLHLDSKKSLLLYWRDGKRFIGEKKHLTYQSTISHRLTPGDCEGHNKFHTTAQWPDAPYRGSRCHLGKDHSHHDRYCFITG